MSNKPFLAALRQASRFVGEDRCGYTFNGVYVELQSGTCTVRATDGYRSFRSDVPAPLLLTSSGLIPLVEVKRLLKAGKEAAHVATHDAKRRPPFESIEDADHGPAFFVPVSALRQAVKLMIAAKEYKDTPVIVSLFKEDNGGFSLRFSFREKRSEGEWSVPTSYPWDGPTIAPCGVDAKYLLDCLKGFGDKGVAEVVVGDENKGTPFVLRESGQNWTAWVMPLRGVV